MFHPVSMCIYPAKCNEDEGSQQALHMFVPVATFKIYMTKNTRISVIDKKIWTLQSKKV